MILGNRISKKKGELTTQQLVVIIVLVASFAILIFFIARLNFAEISNEQICHNSVSINSKTKGIGTSLDCKKEYLCISGGNDCNKINSDEKIKVSNKEEAYEAIAKEMSSCWWMFGEGDLGLPKGCFVCDVIEFSDDSVSLSNSELLNYLKLKKYDESNTYFSEFYRTNDVTAIESKNFLYSPFDVREIEKNEPYLIVMGKTNFVPENWDFGSISGPVFVKQSDFLNEETGKGKECDGIFLTQD